jgi:hypothetical protein
MFIQANVCGGRAMTLGEILSAVRQLPTADKLKLIRILAEDLDTGEDIFPLTPHKVYYLPTPYHAYGAGKVLLDAMQTGEDKQN